MLQKLGYHIKACLSRAEACKTAAEKTTDPEVRKQLTELGLQWEHVVKSYEFIASLERFLLDQVASDIHDFSCGHKHQNSAFGTCLLAIGSKSVGIYFDIALPGAISGHCRPTSGRQMRLLGRF